MRQYCREKKQLIMSWRAFEKAWECDKERWERERDTGLSGLILIMMKNVQLNGAFFQVISSYIYAILHCLPASTTTIWIHFIIEFWLINEYDSLCYCWENSLWISDKPKWNERHKNVWIGKRSGNISHVWCIMHIQVHSIIWFILCTDMCVFWMP